MLLHIKYVSLVNLIADSELVPELIAHLFTEENLQNHLSSLLYENSIREAQMLGYEALAKRLGGAGCASKTAMLINTSLQ